MKIFPFRLVENPLSESYNTGVLFVQFILSDAPNEPQLPLFLKGMTWVDFRKQESGPMKQLIWGITGEKDRF